ncbi:efflux RND transporter periplasmic adaptor subunit [Novosphingopyxis sp.]|uniref:efflux RND transporter periplasmic adaptor subunit n=1 Tax=Novosphingopyxis sp. TaxID=2709690 RepID=UPI003B5BCF3C
MNYESTISHDMNSDAGEAPGIVGAQEERHARRRKRIIIVAVIGVVLLLGLLGYFLSGGKKAAAGDTPAEAAAGGGEQAPVVTVVAPGSNTVVSAINASGTIAARFDTPVGVVGEGGRVVKVYVNAGDWVKQGQILASIDRSVQNQQVSGLQAQISVAQANLDLAESQLGRALQLVDRGFISQADVDRLTAERNRAQAQLRVARASVGEAQARNARLSVVAPTSGIILERTVQPGQTVTQGSGDLFRMATGGEMEMQALLSENDLASLSVGVPAEVTPVGTSTALNGRVWQVAPTIDPQTRQGIARIALSYDKALRPGGFANATIRAGAVSAPVLPESAVQSDDKGNYVYIVGDGNKVVRRPVTIGTATAQGLTIASGLSGTELVVLYAAGFLNPGEAVQPRRQASASARGGADAASPSPPAAKAPETPAAKAGR